MTKTEALREAIKEQVLEIRQYLLNTEFAPEPFTKPVDLKILREKFPNDILRLCKEHGLMFVNIPQIKRGDYDPLFREMDIEPLEVE